MNVIVKENNAGGWLVTLPEYPAGQCWSLHDDRADAEYEASQLAADMGYDGVIVDDGSNREHDRAVRRREAGYAQ